MKDTEISVIEYILELIRSNQLDTVFNKTIEDWNLPMYNLRKFGVSISKEFLEDIKNNVDHYQKIVNASS